MYISCEAPNSGSIEPETGYVPNNPLFGVPLDSPQACSASCVGCVSCQGTSSLSISAVNGSDFDCGNCLDHNGVLSLSQNNLQTSLCSSYWNPEDMTATFPGLPPLDIDPLPSLFPFSSCGASYKSEKPTGDVADVLLSLKNAVLKASPEPPLIQGHNSSFSAPQASLSYTVHPQMLVSPNHHQTQSQTASYGSQPYYDSNCSQHTATPIYPSMSVNVSMNMTMHSYGSEGSVPVQCSQMQWSPQNTSPSVNVLYPPLLSPSHYPAGATYSFTADFRSSSNQNGSLISDSTKVPTVSPHRNCYSSTGSCTPSKTNAFSQMKDAKAFGSGFEEEDSSDGLSTESKPNLCRLCGKTYARPSTLKTHLRTHSGERPYRCPDCNKSFSQAANLTAHVRTHTGQKPFRCPICDRRFSQSSSVTTHMRTHSGERPYRCRACKKAFSDSSTLTKHLRIHSGEKPYQCKLCLLRFSQSGNLNRHMRVHGTNNPVT